MRGSGQYFAAMVYHKYLVFLAGIRLGPPKGRRVIRQLRWWWRLFVHDWTRFLPVEWIPIARYAYGAPDGFCVTCGEPLFPYGDDPLLKVCENPECLSFGEHRASVSYHPSWQWKEAYQQALNHHERWNLHHWQHWVRVFTEPGSELVQLVLLPMPDRVIREMVADWMATEYALTKVWCLKQWYEKNAQAIKLHPETRKKVEALLVRYA